ncbi:MAG TPA: chorismate lyase [Gammaproteobacteria bacterium]|nr:chorismate lyase [Gammaproteobacteria bacterium]
MTHTSWQGCGLHWQGCGLHWVPHRRVLRSRIPASLLYWLLDPTSLTHRVRQACPGRFGVRVVSQGWGRPTHDERRRLAMRRGERSLVRHVELQCDGQAWVFARTVIPAHTLTGARRRLARLGTRPLGEYLFADPSLRRGVLELARVHPGCEFYDLAAGTESASPAPLWGRRSVFRIKDKPLLVSEFFLPALGARANAWPFRS